jgi:S1-C subfamily serine protease
MSVNDSEITSAFQLMHRIGENNVGDTITLEVERNGQTLTLQATLKARPEFLPRR